MNRIKRYLTLALLGIAGSRAEAQTAATGTGIGTITPDSTAQLDISSTSKGLLLPRMTVSQRNAIAGPAAGLTIYNTTTNKLNNYNGTAWVEELTTTEQAFTYPTATFSYTGAVQTYTVPAGVTQIQVTAKGASGGNMNTASLGGQGAQVDATITVTPLEQLNIYVGGAGPTTGTGSTAYGYLAGGFNGGGGILSGQQGGTGGGATDIRRGTSLVNRVVTAAGGGGAGYYNGSSGGAGGAASGSAGSIYGGSTGAGTGGTQTAGGGSSGALGLGGNSGGTISGAGGGGWYGGGGANNYGSLSSGGGGGSSRATGTGITNVTIIAGANSGNGSLVITPVPAAVYATPALSGANFVNVPAGMLTGAYAALNGSAITNLSASNLTGTLTALDGNALTNLNAANLATGTVPAARFPATLPAADGGALTNLNAANLAGTLPALNASALTSLTADNLAGTYAGLNGNAITNLNAANLSGTLPAISGAAINSLNASNLTAGTVPDARFPATLPVVSGVNITALNATNLTSGAVPATRLTSVPAASLTGVYPALNGSAITNLSASSITPGGTLPALNGSALTNLTITEADPKVGALVNGYVPRWNSATTKLDTTAIFSSAGKIGIGTNIPATSLHVAGAGDQEISIQSTSPNGRRWTLQSNASSATLHNSFQIVDRSTGTSRLGIDSAGQVGIGVPAPKQALDVEGGILARNFSPISNQGAYLQWNRSGSEGETFILNQRGSGGAQAGIRFGKSDVANNITEFARFMDNGSFGINTPIPSSTLSVNGTADKIGGGSWGTFSDARVKKNVQNYSAGLKEILAIRPVSFQYNRLSGYTDTAKRFVGVIAQEIEKVLPSTVTILHNDPAVKDKRQYDGSELVYTLINAVKEQQAQIEELKKQNSAQQSVIDGDHASLLSLQQELEFMRTGKMAKR